ncbi:MAG: aspartate--tRNA ligase, partial [Actinomycetota bacterium]
MTTTPDPARRTTSMRTHMCGDLRAGDVGSTVSVCGWVARRREHGVRLACVDLRDHSGVVQCVVDNAVDVRSEWVVRITGTVRARPEGTFNVALPTGSVEIGDCSVEVLNAAEPPPFPVDARADDVDEAIRLRHRYIAIRRERKQRNLRVRAAVNSAIRSEMERNGFVEVETPFLMPSTPEGAREFLVPSRKERGSFYALPQSPQLWKQLLMVAGVDRYYQIARCLRDEDLRADRQYEFMQLDAEMSFVDQEDVLDNIGRAVMAAARAVTGEEPPAIERMTWRAAMESYGVDKPDLRFGMRLVELTDLFAATEFKAFAGAASIKAIRVATADHPEAAASGRNKLDAFTDRANKLGATRLVWIRVGVAGAIDSPIAKFLSVDEVGGLLSRTGAVAGDLVLVVADDWATTCEVLGQLRNDIGRPPVHEGP